MSRIDTPSHKSEWTPAGDHPDAYSGIDLANVYTGEVVHATNAELRDYLRASANDALDLANEAILRQALRDFDMDDVNLSNVEGEPMTFRESTSEASGEALLAAWERQG